MAISTPTMKNALADAYAEDATYGAIYTSIPNGTAGTEPSGGSPAYARKPLTWSSPSNGVVTAVATFDVPTGVTIRGAGVHDALTAGNYLDGAAVTEQAFSSQGTYEVTFTFTVA